MKYTQEQLNDILKLHKMWLNKEEGGKRADLYGADLYGANLHGADLSGADFCGAYLSRAILNGADLSGAHLSGANLRGANLRGANLYGADLSGADLSRADLTSTIYENKLKLEFQYERDPAIYFGLDEIKVGCQRHSIKHWLDNYVKIGKDNEYTEEQIEKYGDWIKYIAELHKKEGEGK